MVTVGGGSYVVPDEVNEVLGILGEDDPEELEESMIDWDKIHKIEHEDGWSYAGRLDREGYFTGNGDLQYQKEPTAEFKKNLPIPQRYVGNFLKGQKYGKGIMTYTNRDVYNGIWEKDRKTGRGIYLGANGDRYIGEFSDGQLHGTGDLFSSSGAKYQGNFVAGKMDAFAKWIMPDGSVMQGPVKYYMREGDDFGIFHRPW
jgi:hypothetical protein